MAMFQKLTIREIGERAGVSIATVSRALNGTGPVSDSAMQKIQSAMKDLGYETAATGQLERKKIILASFPNLNNPFNSKIISGISDAAEKHGYKVVFYANENYTLPAGYDFLENADFYDGLIIAHTLPDQQRLVQLSLKRPVVMCSEHISGCNIPYIAIDDYKSACMAVNYLISTGRTKIACINSALSNNYALHRERGYRDCLEKAGLVINEKWILHLPSIDFDIALGSLDHLFSGEEHPDAFFCVSDVFAASVINYAASHGIRVPQDISVIGFDDIPQAVMMSPSISTVRQPSYQMGFQACSLLIEKIGDPLFLPHKIILNTDLILRNST